MRFSLPLTSHHSPLQEPFNGCPYCANTGMATAIHAIAQNRRIVLECITPPPQTPQTTAFGLQILAPLLRKRNTRIRPDCSPNPRLFLQFDLDFELTHIVYCV